MLTTGPLAPYFWIEIIGCAICAVICFTPALRTNILLVAGSLLAILGIFCKRVQLLVGGFQLANLDYAGPLTPMQHTAWDSGLSGIYGGMVYWPTPLELGVTLGVVALGVLVFLLGLKAPAPSPERRRGAFRVTVPLMCRPAPPLPGAGPFGEIDVAHSRVWFRRGCSTKEVSENKSEAWERNFSELVRCRCARHWPYRLGENSTTWGFASALSLWALRARKQTPNNSKILVQ